VIKESSRDKRDHQRREEMERLEMGVIWTASMRMERRRK